MAQQNATTLGVQTDRPEAGTESSVYRLNRQVRLGPQTSNLYYAQLQWCGRNRVVGRPDPEEEEEEEEIEEITQTDIQYIQENLNADNENIGAMDNIESININDILTTEESAFNASTTQAPAMLDQEMNEVENERIGNLDLQNQNDVIFDEQEANTSPIAPALVLVNANAIITREAKKDDDSGIPRKKKEAQSEKKCQLLSCETKFRVRKLDCGHRYCVPCIRNFISRFCPQCRRPIGNYLPPEHMGGERWELGEDQQLEREFAHQTTRERIDLINSTRRQHWSSSIQINLDIGDHPSSGSWILPKLTEGTLGT
ncbi:unnamed protein product [Trichogramma brassicae]|uniref:RING-type domain-containing protein n=1 Tax=Trichogramma brassicae TaxID=86971 RepID=A0A6H5J286_9HYME|nr:unnamed protein product [Trichogramma brassicae]